MKIQLWAQIQPQIWIQHSIQPCFGEFGQQVVREDQASQRRKGGGGGGQAKIGQLE